jgi:hypothetical protein
VSLPGAINFRITEEDHYAVNRLVLARSLGRLRPLLLLVVGLAVLSIAVNVLLERSVLDGLMPLIVGVAVGGLAALGMFVTLKPRARKIYRETASLREEMTLVFEDGGFRIEQLSGLWRVRWGDLVRWDENHDIFAVFPNRQMTIIVPKKQVNEDVVNFIREQRKLSGLPLPWKLRK